MLFGILIAACILVAMAAFGHFIRPADSQCEQYPGLCAGDMWEQGNDFFVHYANASIEEVAAMLFSLLALALLFIGSMYLLAAFGRVLMKKESAVSNRQEIETENKVTDMVFPFLVSVFVIIGLVLYFMK